MPVRSGFVVHGLLALSFAPSFGAEERARVRTRATRIAAELYGVDPAVRSWCDAELFNMGVEVFEAPDGGYTALLVRCPITPDGVALDAAGLLERVRRRGNSTFIDVVPPFGACVRVTAEAPLFLVTDTCGVRPISWWRGAGWAAASTSSALLGAIAETALDVDAIGGFALAGHFLGTRTVATSVSVLAAATGVALHRGRAEVITLPIAPPPAAERKREAVREGSAAVRAAIGASLSAHPETSLELSGGFDTRMMLAAIPRERRPGLRAVTIASPTTTDAEIARSLATQESLVHHVVDRAALPRLEPDTAEARARDATRRRDFATDALAAAEIDRVESYLEQGPRLTGANGEFAQGANYELLPVWLLEKVHRHGSVTDRLVDAVASWRFFTNQRVDAALFAPNFLEDAESDARRVMREQFRGFDCDWASATDELYLDVRMRRWAGAEYGAAALDRPVLAPFFHPAYLAWARHSRPHQKRNSVLFSRVLMALAPELAGLPLDHGRPSPRAVARGGLPIRVHSGSSTARRAVSKVRQRIDRKQGSAVPEGAPDFARLVVRSWMNRGDALARLEQLAFLDHAVVRAVSRGERSVNPASVGFLLTLDAVVELNRVVGSSG